MKWQVNVEWRKSMLFFFFFPLLKQLHALILNVNFMQFSLWTFILNCITLKIMFNSV